MKKLLAAYKALPTELRILVAMAGVGTPAGIVYLLKNVLDSMFGRKFAMWQCILIVAAFVAVICIVGWLLTKIFGMAKNRRKKGMAAALVSERGSGPASMETAASIKANNEKFFKAIKDMKKSLNTDVFDLPWYIVIGDAGCGKTRLIEKGGLTFSAGRPEGYQLGTLNYNWWFTEDAVFVDMAGRLCNPQDDGDYREWGSFLDTIAKGRKGFPINGAIVCVSAQHLLEDAPEKIEADANTALERLRDLQTKLGVTFATYVVITKSDKVLGFMQFFDRAERDIRKKQEIFGWSKPGDFSELYDPEDFANDFDGLYARLHDLRIHRLNDDVEQDELGMAYSYPEEFREFKEPLSIYVRTLFPMIKNPRGVKNLVFRGLYFTSATQEGSLVLKHLVGRMGEDAAGQFQTLDLYPQKKPLFIKDLLFEKVFPEFGLVFRNEDQVHRNKSMAKILRYGSVGMTLVLFGLMTLGYLKFDSAVGKPRDDAKKAIPGKVEKSNALEMATTLREDIKALNDNRWWARILSVGVGAGVPIERMQYIHASMVEDKVMRPALLEINDALRSRPITKDDEWKQYYAAMSEYVAWYACREQTSSIQADMKAEAFHATMYGIVPNGAFSTKQEPLKAAVSTYFNDAKDHISSWKKNPATLLDGKRREGEEGGPLFDGLAIIDASILQSHNYLARTHAAFGADHSDPEVAAWFKIFNACRTIEEEYGKICAMAEEFDRTTNTDQLKSLRERFLESHRKFESAMSAATIWPTEARQQLVTKIPTLGDKLVEQRQKWLDYGSKLLDAAARCSDRAPELEAVIVQLQKGNESKGLPGLDRMLWTNLHDAGMAKQEKYFPEVYNTPGALTEEVDEHFPYLIKLVRGADSSKPDVIELTPSATAVRAVVQTMAERLEKAQFAVTEDSLAMAPSEWNDLLYERLDAMDKPAVEPDALKAIGVDWSDRDVTAFKPKELKSLYASFAALIQRGENSQLLETINQSLQRPGEWGFAELVPGYNKPTESAFAMRVGAADVDSGGRKPVESIRRPGGRRPPRGGAAPSAAAQPAVIPTGAAATGQIPQCATHAFLQERSIDCADLIYYLGQFDSTTFLGAAGDSRPLNELCRDNVEALCRRYMEMYVRSWAGAYQGRRLEKLAKLSDASTDWTNLKTAVRDWQAAVNGEITSAMGEVLKSVRFATFDPQRGWWSQLGADYAKVAEWYKLALSKEWPREYSEFAIAAEVPADALNANMNPWDRIATDFASRWDKLAQAVAGCKELPREFDRNTPKMAAIPWDTIRSRRTDCKLVDERFTGELAEFESKVQQLLSGDLTESYVKLQDRWFRNVTPTEDGWPFLSKQDLTTVEFDRFTKFLLEVREARRVLESLDSLPERTPGFEERRDFLQRCDTWSAFIDFKDNDQPQPLTFKVRPDYPDSGVADGGPQKYYKVITLQLGLREKKEGSTDQSGRLDIFSSVEPATGLKKEREVIWDWSRNALGSSDLRVRLTEGLPLKLDNTQRFEDVAIDLGKASELALCAYLYTYGKPDSEHDRKNWSVTHVWNLTERFKGRGQLEGALESGLGRVGVKLQFRFDRELPRAIPPIRRMSR